MENNYIIMHLDRPGKYLEAVSLEKDSTELTYTEDRSKAIRLNKEEAEATIEFITNVIDWEEGEQLHILRVM